MKDHATMHIITVEAVGRRAVEDERSCHIACYKSRRNEEES